MAVWLVTRPEVYHSIHRVEADTELGALDMVFNGELDNEILLEYSRTLERDDCWAVEEIDS
jgi:hypothetical protein